MAESSGRRVLAVGDAGSDLVWLAGALDGASLDVDVVRGVLHACLALRRADYGAVVADLEVADEGALAIVRAAGRTHPAPRVLCLLAATGRSREPVLSALEASGARSVRHPVQAEALRSLVAELLADYEAEGAASARVVPLTRRFPEHEETLAASLRTFARDPRRAPAMAHEVAQALERALGPERGVDAARVVALALRGAARQHEDRGAA
jgi:DNA-binding NtrC family response regulator